MFIQYLMFITRSYNLVENLEIRKNDLRWMGIEFDSIGMECIIPVDSPKEDIT